MGRSAILVLIAATSWNYAFCDPVLLPIALIKLGISPHDLLRLLGPNLMTLSTPKSRNANQPIRSNQSRPQKSVHHSASAITPLPGITEIHSAIKNIRKTDLDHSTTMPTTAPTASPKSGTNCDTSESGQAALRANGVARSCAPGENCRIYLRSFETSDPLFQYSYAHSSALEPVMQNIYDSTRTSAFAPPLTPDAIIAPEVVKLSMGLMKALRANRVLVVGVFTGLSVIGAALSVEHGGQVIGVEDPRYVKYWDSIGRKYALEAGLVKNIVIQSSGRVDEYLEQLAVKQPHTFDFVVLDDSDMENYGRDYEQALKLLRPKGIMIVNDALAEGTVLSGLQTRNKTTEIMTNLNKKIRDDNRLANAVMMPFGGGIMMVVKK